MEIKNSYIGSPCREFKHLEYFDTSEYMCLMKNFQHFVSGFSSRCCHILTSILVLSLPFLLTNVVLMQLCLSLSQHCQLLCCYSKDKSYQHFKTPGTGFLEDRPVGCGGKWFTDYLRALHLLCSLFLLLLCCNI